MTKIIAYASLALMLGLAPTSLAAQEAKAVKAGQKICRYKLSTGKIKTWTCAKEQPCCASETFGLFTCGSTIINCL